MKEILTPLTDAETITLLHTGSGARGMGDIVGHNWYVKADFARQLERDRHELREALTQCLRALEPGIAPGPTEMTSLEGRAKWLHNTRPIRDEAHALLERMKP